LGKFLDCLNLPTETSGESFAAGAKAAEWQTAVFFGFLGCSPGACFAGIPGQMMTTSHIKMVGTLDVWDALQSKSETALQKAGCSFTWSWTLEKMHCDVETL
jgi:hypothetical protein